jgi:leucyl aminopeptidase
MTPIFADPAAPSLPLHLVAPERLEDFLSAQAPETGAWLRASGFEAGLAELRLLPGAGGLAGAVLGLGTAKARSRSRFALAKAATALPGGSWHLSGDVAPDLMRETALGWLLAGYRFDRYRSKTTAAAALLKCPEGIDPAPLLAIAEGEFLTRDLINTPASDMGPAELEAAFLSLAAEFGAAARVIRGDELLAENFPMIHAVGRASDRAPRLLEMTWGASGPMLTLVGKGVCFDTGGLNIKPSSGMSLMKKDMGGAATVMGLARMIMQMALPIRLRVLVPAVENSISGRAMRPKDILTSRKGLTVEVNDTDAEGRLVLADALAYACETPSDLLISMATLTGAARVAVGPDLAPYYTDDPGVVQALEAGALAGADPVWRLPFHNAYESVIEPGIADLDNAPGFGFAGSITAALFLRRFVEGPRYLHFDIYGHTPADQPARPKGGVGQGARAVFSALPALLGF